MTKKRLRISLKREPAMEVHQSAIRDSKLVYVICADKKIRYPKESSAVVYIGATRKGISRVAASAAYRSKSILRLHGVNNFQVRIMVCRVRKGVQTYHQLERALLLEFKETYGCVPRCNVAGKHYEEMNEFVLFRQKRVRKILADLAEPASLLLT